MWRIEYRPATLLWLLGILLAAGTTLRLLEWWGAAPSLPLTVVQDTSTVMQARVDSILLQRARARQAPVYINSASATELERLRGVGPVLAAAIVAYRDRHGPFGSVDELTNVSGIGPKRLEQLRSQCALDSL